MQVNPPFGSLQKDTHLVLLLTVDEDERVFAGRAVADLDHRAAVLLHRQVAEHVELNLLSKPDINLPGAGLGSSLDVVAQFEGEVAIVSRNLRVVRLLTLLT